MTRIPIGLGSLLLMVSAAALTEPGSVPTRFTSGKDRVALVELYTSEGCSSCPPADRWLSKLKSDPRLWRAFVPVAFHVDYWDYIGWKDRFARPAFSDRQRRYAAARRARTVYTPGFFQNGEEWLGWFRGDSFDPDTSPVGTLQIRLDDAGFTAEFAPRHQDYGALVIHFAVLGMGLRSEIKAGENAGSTLEHDFVALETMAVRLDKQGERYFAKTTLPIVDHVEGDRAIVAWVVEMDDPTPIQAVGGILPD